MFSETVFKLKKLYLLQERKHDYVLWPLANQKHCFIQCLRSNIVFQQLWEHQEYSIVRTKIQ